MNTHFSLEPAKYPFVTEYRRIVCSGWNAGDFKQACTSGELRTSSLRSLVWRILLRCLPIEREEWVNVLARQRAHYSELKEQYIKDPRDDPVVDPNLNNPLSHKEECAWNQYFADGELRDLIAKDVQRTFPEIELFHRPDIRLIISTALFVYAKDHKYLSYKQGMHEILAPLVFVLYSDQQAYAHAEERGEIRALNPGDANILRVLNDSTFTEHDAYGLFCEVMMELTVWYEDCEIVQNIVELQPFQRVQDGENRSHLQRELMQIGQSIADLDPHLHAHLSLLDIPTQLYGIRWLRLLFGREFPMHDLLFLWDIVFSDRPIPHMVECIFAAMLVHIRPLLLSSDYSGCLQYLMRYPPVVDVMSFVQLALHFRFPKKYARPKAALTNYAHMTVNGSAHPNRRNRPERVNAAAGGQREMGERQRRRYTMESGGAHRRPSVQKQQKAQTAEYNYEQEMHVLEQQMAVVAVLQQKLNERDIVAGQCARQIDTIVAELPGAQQPEERTNLAERLRGVGAQLEALTARPVPPPATPPQQHPQVAIQDHGPIEMAREVKVRSTPRMGKHNEMREIRTMLLK